MPCRSERCQLFDVLNETLAYASNPTIDPLEKIAMETHVFLMRAQIHDWSGNVDKFWECMHRAEDNFLELYDLAQSAEKPTKDCIYKQLDIIAKVASDVWGMRPSIVLVVWLPVGRKRSAMSRHFRRCCTSRAIPR